jgi:membrane-associated phospholipid phosphatase
MLAAARALTLRTRALIVVAALAAVAGVTAPRAERYGDNLQIALPILALGCSVLNGEALEYTGRYVVMFVGIHGTKRALGDVAINRRPGGSLQGMPSGHTATAAFGASALVQSCLLRQPAAQAVVILAAAFTGASRISSGAHTIWQVLAGAIWGLLCDRALRRGGAGRRLVLRLWARLRLARG